MKRWIMKRGTMAVVAFLLIAPASSAWAASEQVQILQDANAVLHDFVTIPENAIPPALLDEAYGIAVIPSVVKAGFVVGGQYGEGVLTVRTKDGTWSNPVFIDLAGASIGWQIGASSTDVVLVFKTQRGVDQIADGQVTLGAGASIAAGPVGRSAKAATNLGLDAEIYSYSRSRGLFAGVALEGGVISIDEEANWRFYDQMGLDALTILSRSDASRLPPAGERFIYTLDRYVPPADGGAVGAPAGTGTQSPNRREDGFGNGYSRPYPSNGGSDGPGYSQPYPGNSAAGGGYDRNYSGGYNSNAGSGAGY